MTCPVLLRGSPRLRNLVDRSWLSFSLHLQLAAPIAASNENLIAAGHSRMLHGRHAENVRFGVLLALVAACFLMGGASRVDVLSLVLLQPFAALCAVTLVLLPGPFDWRSVRVPLLLLAALAGVMAAQLIPLPPALWANLPGHAPFARSAELAGLAQPWRPISMTPDLTLASLVGLIVPGAVLIGFASIGPPHRRSLLTAVIAGTAASALFGLAQVSGGTQSPFYLYEVTNLGAAVGLFSNRNHQAVLLAMAWPMLVVWATMPHRDARRRAAGRWIAAGFALFLVPLLLVTGSRAGLVLGVIGLGFAAFLWREHRRAGAPAPQRFERFLLPAIGIGGVAVLVATVILSRAEAIQRFLDLDAFEDSRLETTPVLVDLARDFFPVGSGFGSFDPVFRVYEPLEMLGPTFLNHAHNDVLELIITGGLPGILVAILFLMWFGRNAFRVWRNRDATQHAGLSRVASAMILLVLLSSVVDYPLRTPLMMAIFSIACGWLAMRPEPARQMPAAS